MEDIVKAFFEQSFQDFVVCERANILSGVSERNLCSRLALQLEALKELYGFGAYYADTEYDRKQGGNIKTILDGKMRVVRIVSDLIVHSRGLIDGRDNLIAIEMKKSGRPGAESVKDRDRLKAMTKRPGDEIWSADGTAHPDHVCGYELGLFIELNVAAGMFTIEEFRVGQSLAVWKSGF